MVAKGTISHKFPRKFPTSDSLQNFTSPPVASYLVAWHNSFKVGQGVQLNGRNKVMNSPTKDLIPESAMEITPTKVKSKNKTKEVKAKSPAPMGELYGMGEAKYSPRVEHNSVAWEKMQSAIIKGKGKATHAELCAALDEHFKKTGEHHHDFIGYMTRRGSIKVLAA